jgi:hypothetical protein
MLKSGFSGSVLAKVTPVASGFSSSNSGGAVGVGSHPQRAAAQMSVPRLKCKRKNAAARRPLIATCCALKTS